MFRKRFIKDLDECERLWKTLTRPKYVSDIWEFRICFQRHFKCNPCFMVLEDSKGIAGMLPLSYSDELERLVFFPGETWEGKTWIERTPIFSRRPEYLPELLASCPMGAYLRYMELSEAMSIPGVDLDEIGYVLYPPELDFSLATYRRRFSNKKFKSIIKTIHALTGSDAHFHFNRLTDFDTLAELNLQRFGPDSYMYDQRFRESFRDMMAFLERRGWLRLVSLEIEGKIVAVDIGALYGNTYTVLLGGTHPDFPGVAKVMNMHHVEAACDKGIQKVDFLCGDFHWKKLWHLDPEPLYKYVTPSSSAEEVSDRDFMTDNLGYLGEGLSLA